MERFDLAGAVCKDTFTGRLIMGVMTDIAGSKMFEVFKLNVKDDPQNGGIVDVQISFNGVEVPLAAFVKAWDRNRAWFAMKDVRELVKRRMGRLYDRIGSIERGLDGIIDTEFPEWNE